MLFHVLSNSFNSKIHRGSIINTNFIVNGKFVKFFQNLFFLLFFFFFFLLFVLFLFFIVITTILLLFLILILLLFFLLFFLVFSSLISSFTFFSLSFLSCARIKVQSLWLISSISFAPHAA